MYLQLMIRSFYFPVNFLFPIHTSLFHFRFSFSACVITRKMEGQETHLSKTLYKNKILHHQQSHKRGHHHHLLHHLVDLQAPLLHWLSASKWTANNLATTAQPHPHPTLYELAEGVREGQRKQKRTVLLKEAQASLTCKG